MGVFASVNGDVVPADQARVSVLDNGFLFGDGVYETLRTYDGRPFRLDLHLARLRESALRIGIALPPDAELARRLYAVLAQAANSESYVRFVVTRGTGDCSYHLERVHGPTIVVLVKPYEPLSESVYAEGLASIVSSLRRNHRQALDPAIKSCNLLNNILAVREAQARGIVEPILLNLEGELAEGASSNLFLVSGGALLTPPLEAGILAGITRHVVIELCRDLGIPCHERSLQPDALFGAEEAFFTSTLKEAAPIVSVDGRAIGSGRPGPVTLRLLAAIREYAPRHCD